MQHHGAMRRLAALLIIVVGACVPGTGEDAAAPDVTSDASEGERLPAVDPPPPSLAAFANEAVASCLQATGAIEGAPLRRDPLGSTARPRDVRAAVAHYATVSRAWTAAAGRLWEHGLPEHPSGQTFVSALDTYAAWAQRVAEQLASGDTALAQEALGVADDARRQADTAAEVLGLGSLDACGRPSAGGPVDQRVIVRARDFAFDVAPVVARGPTRFVLHNRGQEDHHLYVVRLRDPGTLTAALAADRRGDPPGRFLAGEGVESPTARPGDRARVDVRLRRGTYALLCFVASPDGTPHAYKGMATEITIGD